MGVWKRRRFDREVLDVGVDDPGTTEGMMKRVNGMQRVEREYAVCKDLSRRSRADVADGWLLGREEWRGREER